MEAIEVAEELHHILKSLRDIGRGWGDANEHLSAAAVSVDSALSSFHKRVGSDAVAKYIKRPRAA